MTATTPLALAKYRADCHRIKPARDFDTDIGRFVNVCGNDGIRIYQTESERWWHDRTEIRDLVALERGEGIQW